MFLPTAFFRRFGQDPSDIDAQNPIYQHLCSGAQDGGSGSDRRREAIDEGIGAKLSGDAQQGEADKALRHVAALTDEVSENAKVDVEPVPGVVVVRDCKRGVAALG